MDIMPLSKGHTLLIPKTHRESVYDLSPEDAGSLFSVAPKIAAAIKETFNPEGMNLLNNNGAKAGQSIFHFHLHFIPRYGQGDGFGAIWKTHNDDYSTDDLKGIAESISKHIS